MACAWPELDSAPDAAAAAVPAPGRHRAAGGVKLAREESAEGVYSAAEILLVDGNPEHPYAVIAPKAGAEGSTAKLPTILAISGEQQHHVSRFFRAMRADDRGWQMIVPLRPRIAKAPYLHQAEGAEWVVALMRRLAAAEAPSLAPHRVSARGFHLIGSSNGGASVLAVATRAPELVASLTILTGYLPSGLGSLGVLKAVPLVRLYVGDLDDSRAGPAEVLEIQHALEEAGVAAKLQVLEGARHGDIGHFLDMDLFWLGLEAVEAGLDLDAGDEAEAGPEAKGGRDCGGATAAGPPAAGRTGSH